LTKTLGAYEYGIWSLVTLTIALLATISTFGIPQALERFLPVENDKKKIEEYVFSSLFIVLLSSLIITVIFFLYSKILTKIIFHSLEAESLIKVSSLILLFTGLNSINLMVFRSRRQIRRMYVFELLQLYGELGLTAYLVFSGHKLFSILLAMVIVRAIVFFVSLLFIIRKIGIRFPTFQYIKPCLVYGLPTMVLSFVYWIVESSNRYIIQFFMDPTHVGIYSAAYGIGSIIALLRTPFMVVLPPFIFKFWDENNNYKVQTFLQYSFKYYLLISIPALLGLIVLSKPILAIMSRKEFLNEGAAVIPFVAIAMFFYGITGITGLIFWLRKKPIQVLLMWSLAAIFNIILNIIFIPKMGIRGAAIATLVSYVIATIVSTLVCFRYIKIHIEWNSILKSLLASVFMALFIYLFNPLTLINVLTAVILGMLIYFTALIFIKGIKPKEYDFLKSLVFSLK
jgi:O-antigen/teichoic acid export membrane protein